MVKKRGSKRGKEGAATYHGEEVDPPDEERAGAAHLRPSPEPAGLSNGTGSDRRGRRRPGERGNGEWHLWRRAAAPVCASALAKFFCARLKDNGRGSRARHGHGWGERRATVTCGAGLAFGVRGTRCQWDGGRGRHRVLAAVIAACRGPGPAGVGVRKLRRQKRRAFEPWEARRRLVLSRAPRRGTRPSTSMLPGRRRRENILCDHRLSCVYRV
jgi:hypothetical protein